MNLWIIFIEPRSIDHYFEPIDTHEPMGHFIERIDHYHECVHGSFSLNLQVVIGERSGSVVECLTRDQGTAGSSLTGVTAFCP